MVSADRPPWFADRRRPLWLDKQGHPITDEQAFTLKYDFGPENGAVSEYARIGFTEIGEQKVSTVWLGLDHQFLGGPPLIFETMIFGGPHDRECTRYCTEADAIAGHAATVAALQRGDAPEWIGEIE
jgi:hypothetical protein